MNASFQRETVAKLTSYCERMIMRGKLPELDELNLRVFVNLTCSAFDMAPLNDNTSLAQSDRITAVVGEAVS